MATYVHHSCFIKIAGVGKEYILWPDNPSCSFMLKFIPDISIASL